MRIISEKRRTQIRKMRNCEISSTNQCRGSLCDVGKSMLDKCKKNVKIGNWNVLQWRTDILVKRMLETVIEKLHLMN